MIIQENISANAAIIMAANENKNLENCPLP
jgi:hypothetical protein